MPVAMVAWLLVVVVVPGLPVWRAGAMPVAPTCWATSGPAVW